MEKRNSLFERNEMKYLMTVGQKERFLGAILTYITPDKYSQYPISNVYMDTPDFRLIRRSLDKPVYKEKMRLRSYGPVNGQQEIFVELKKKYNGTVYKRRVRMPLNEASDYLEGRMKKDGQIESEIDYFRSFYKDISQAMFISYDREAYHGIQDSNLRITFDMNLLWRDEDVSLSSQPYGNRILKTDQCLMEIKSSRALPLWLTKALTANRIYKTSFSKYGEAYMQMTACSFRKAAGL